MGYTHYWTQHRELTSNEWAEITRQFNYLMDNLPPYSESAGGYYKEYPLIIRDTWGEGNGPSVTNEAIGFNGDVNTKYYAEYLKRESSMDHEGFWLSRLNNSWTFCKTERKPYDLIVCVTLLIARNVAPDAISIDSDGRPCDTSEDWRPARELYQKLFGSLSD